MDFYLVRSRPFAKEWKGKTYRASFRILTKVSDQQGEAQRFSQPDMKDMVWSVTYLDDFATGKSVSREVSGCDERQGDEEGYDAGGHIKYFSARPMRSWQDVPETVKKKVTATLVNTTYVRYVEKLLGVQQQDLVTDEEIAQSLLGEKQAQLAIQERERQQSEHRRLIERQAQLAIQERERRYTEQRRLVEPWEMYLKSNNASIVHVEYGKGKIVSHYVSINRLMISVTFDNGSTKLLSAFQENIQFIGFSNPQIHELRLLYNNFQI